MGEPRCHFDVHATIGHRKSMEDFYCVVALNKHITCYLVFDGHGGSEAAEYACENLPPLMYEIFNNARNMEVIGKGIEKIFLIIDKKMHEKGITGGTTVTGAIVSSNPDDAYIVLLNLGDSHTMIYDRLECAIINQTPVHKPNVPEEMLRIHKSGGVVVNDKLDARITVSRALGDYDFGKIIDDKYVIDAPLLAIPSIDIYPYYPGALIIRATDGFWDFFPERYLSNYINLPAEELVDLCLQYGSHDNITVLKTILEV